MSAIELLPCPFCGASGLGNVLGGLTYDGPLDLDGGLGMVSSGIGYYAIRCRDCECRGPNVRAPKDKAVSAAIKAWNKRAEPKQTTLSDLFGIWKEDE